MKKQTICMMIITMLVCSVNVLAASSGAVSTDRFGYTGVVKKYATLADAQSGANQVGDDITVSNRDLSLYIVNDFTSYDTDYNIIMGSWWYTTVDNTNGYAKDNKLGDRLYSGWGNTRGNTGVGFIQLYDEDGGTDTSLSMGFTNYNGTCWTQFELSLSGTNAIYDTSNASNDYARLSPFTSNVNDKGIYLSYVLTLTATGLEGYETTPGLIESINHPTGVTGTYTGIFQNTTSSENQGFYVFSFTLDMTNWAFEQGDDALNGNFYDSYFASPIPEPTTMLLLACGAVLCKKSKKA